jgi:hypothetical protein
VLPLVGSEVSADAIHNANERLLLAHLRPNPEDRFPR